MAPIALLLVFLRYYVAHSWGASKLIDEDDEQQTDEDDQDDQQDDQDDEKAKVTCITYIIAEKIMKHDNYYNGKYLQEEKKSLKERVAAVQEVTQLVQNTIGDIASFGEKIKK